MVKVGRGGGLGRGSLVHRSRDRRGPLHHPREEGRQRGSLVTLRRGLVTGQGAWNGDGINSMQGSRIIQVGPALHSSDNVDLGPIGGTGHEVVVSLVLVVKGGAEDRVGGLGGRNLRFSCSFLFL